MRSGRRHAGARRAHRRARGAVVRPGADPGRHVRRVDRAGPAGPVRGDAHQAPPAGPGGGAEGAGEAAVPDGAVRLPGHLRGAHRPGASSTSYALRQHGANSRRSAVARRAGRPRRRGAASLRHEIETLFVPRSGSSASGSGRGRWATTRCSSTSPHRHRHGPDGGIPRTDPYSFTSDGHAWVVQSWLGSLVYGVAERRRWAGWVRLEQAVLTGAGAARRDAGPHRTAARTARPGLLAVGIGAAYWSPRPLPFGLVRSPCS